MAGDDTLPGPTLRVLDREGKATNLPSLQPTKEEWVTAIVWSAIGDRAYLITHDNEFKSSTLAAFDVLEKTLLWSITTDGIGGWCVPPDGKSVVIVTQKGMGEKVAVHARRVDAKTGKELGVIELRDVIGFDDIGYTTVNNRGEIHVHPDGKTVFLIDKKGRTVAVDVATWNTVATRLNLSAYTVFSPDGKMTLVPEGRHVVLHETDTGKRLSPNEPGGSLPDHLTRLNFSPKSDRVTRSGGYKEPTMGWDVASGKVTGRVEWKDDPTPPGKYHEALSADGQKKAVLEHEKDAWRVTVTSVNRPKDPPLALKAGWGKNGIPYRWMSFTPDARHLVGYEPAQGLHIWNTKSEGMPTEVKIPNDKTGWVFGEAMQISPSGRQLMVVDRGCPGGQLLPPRDKWKWQIGVFEIPSGELGPTFKGSGELASSGWIDDRVLGVIDLSRFPSPFDGADQVTERKFKLLSLDPAAKVKREYPVGVDVRAWAAAPFGDTVAVGSSDGLRLYEASSGKLRHTFRGQTRPVEVLAFSPDGKTLASESADGPVVLWDVKGELTKPAKPDAAGWEAAWQELTGDDAEKAFAAVRLVAAYPDDGAAELAKRFAEAKAPNAVAAERAVEGLRLADTDSARKQIVEWAKGDSKHPLTVAAKRK